MNYFKQLKEKINGKRVKICVIGLGYVGLPLVVNFAKKGFFVYGLDTNISRIDKLKKGKKYIVDIEPEDVLKLIKKDKFLPTDKKEVLKDSDIIIICVPTPLRKVKTPDISFVKKAAKTIKKHIRPGQLIVLESTSYPTTTREVVLPELKKSGLLEEKDFFLCFSPERVNPGDKKHPITKIPKLVGGLSFRSTKLAKSLYSKIIKEVYSVSSPEVAETSKLLENTYRLVNIALISEFTMVAEKL
ncbi:MAG: nucleotide sugar dehydrogenase, partial [Candidatus Omnitrophica bacterium]|nr:nucleotide sugar dehydrogenase [Candidatus Omnitrophota bacterium]